MGLDESRFILAIVGEEIAEMTDQHTTPQRSGDLIEVMKKKTGLNLQQILFAVQSCIYGKPN